MSEGTRNDRPVCRSDRRRPLPPVQSIASRVCAEGCSAKIRSEEPRTRPPLFPHPLTGLRSHRSPERKPHSGASTVRQSSSTTRAPARWTRSMARTISSLIQKMRGAAAGLDADHRHRKATHQPRAVDSSSWTRSTTSPFAKRRGRALHLTWDRARCASATCSTPFPVPRMPQMAMRVNAALFGFIPQIHAQGNDGG